MKLSKEIGMLRMHQTDAPEFHSCMYWLGHLASRFIVIEGKIHLQ